MSRLHAERGASAVELAILLPILLLLTFALLPLVRDMQNYNNLDNALGAGVRYATKAFVNAQRIEDVEDPLMAAACGPIRRRRSALEVQNHTFQAARAGDGPIAAPGDVTVTVIQPPPSPTITDPCNALPGSVVRLSVSYEQGVNPLFQIPNGVARLFGGSEPFQPATRVLTAEAVLE